MENVLQDASQENQLLDVQACHQYISANSSKVVTIYQVSWSKTITL